MRKRVSYADGSLNPFLSKINGILTDMDLSPTSLSVMAGLGSSTVSNLIKRNNIPTFATLVKICAVLDIRLSSFIKDLEDTHPEMFAVGHAGIKRYDPLSKRKEQIVEDLSALPVKDRDETIKRIIEEYGSTDEIE